MPGRLRAWAGRYDFWAGVNKPNLAHIMGRYSAVCKAVDPTTKNPGSCTLMQSQHHHLTSSAALLSRAQRNSTSSEVPPYMFPGHGGQTCQPE